ncbi:MAG: hypothetical protein M1821_008418 [Bathelium mastoideum]|nr:MAG: hypothetical protein M1821_008418 [Bathelium mastoideum]
MASLTPTSAQAIARLRAYVPPPTSWHALPLSRRAAVLILLFADRKGDLRVVLTIRSSILKNYAGQAALPGGKSDSGQETPFQTARREAFEEIGLPLTSTKLPPPFAVEHLTEFPCQLAITNLGVRPCVAFLAPSADRSSPRANTPTATTATAAASVRSQQPGATSNPDPTSSTTTTSLDHDSIPDVESTLIPRLDAKEVAAVFTAPFRHFLKLTADPDWYRGQWTAFQGTRWKMHNFYVPLPDPAPGAGGRAGREEGRDEKRGQQQPPNIEQQRKGGREGTIPREGKRGGGGNVAQGVVPEGWKADSAVSARDAERKGYKDQGTTAGLVEHPEQRFRVFGLTARILVDAARVAYGEEPEFEANAHLGDEDTIARLLREGYLMGDRRQGEEWVRRVAKF